jgi:4-diphosphocytidyl-2-C-methyl-D-erythritol kinase
MAPLASPLHAVVALPDARCSTGEVYRAFDELGRGRLQSSRVRALAGAATALAQRELFNDLAEPAIAVAPELRTLARDLSRLAEREAHITGSGSTLFVICDDAMHAEALAAAVEQQMKLHAMAVTAFARQPA